MKILLLNQSWLAEELRALGHEVVTCGHIPTLQVHIPKRVIPIQEVLTSLGGFSPDVLVFLDDSMPALLMSGLDTCDIPSVFFSVDTHQHLEAHRSIAPLFDHILVAQRDYIPHLLQTGTPVSWFPLWAPRDIEPSTEKHYPAAFVGTLDTALNPRRVAFFEALQKRVPIYVASGDYARVFPFAQLVINQTVKGDLNFRVFEAMMCGALLVTERTENGLLEIFEEGKHLITYRPDNVDEVVGIFHELQRHPHRSQEIASAGRSEVLAHHTGMHRAAILDRLVRSLKKVAHRPESHYASMINTATINRLLIRMGAGPCAHAASSGILAAENALDKNIQLSERETMMLIATCGVFDRLTSAAAGAELLRRFQERHPQVPLLAFARIYSLLERGEESAAMEIAAQKFQISPEQACGIAREVIPKIIRGELLLPPE
jgi:hypothetical protein